MYLNIFSPPYFGGRKYIQIYFLSPPPPQKKNGGEKIFKYFLFHTWSIVD